MGRADQPAKSDYEHVGRLMETVFAGGFAGSARLFWLSFWRGIAFGLGAALGGTIAVAFLLYILSQLSDIPFIGDIFETIRSSIDAESAG